MNNSESLIFPLAKVTDAQLEALCIALWEWDVCNGCSVTHPCTLEDCARRRFSRLKPFFDDYKELAASYVPEDITGQAISSHDDIFDIIKLIKSDFDTPRSLLTSEHFGQSGKKDCVIGSDQHRSFNLAMRILTMVHCSNDGQSGGLLETGTEASPWNGDKSVRDFVLQNFPTTDHPSLNENDEFSPDIKVEMTAVKLKKVAGMSFVGTSDLRNHLKLDQKRGTVEIFHHTAFLKEYLISSKKGDPTIIPRQLALETLDSMQKILFPLDLQSRAMLRSLVSKQGFDPDCLRFGSSDYRQDSENNIVYQYWGSRLMDLYDEIENPTPRGYIDIWLERKSKARHVMLATLVGVIIAILLGVLGLAVAIFQSWVGYEAWKHPMSDSSS